MNGDIEAWKLRLKETDEALVWVYQFEIMLEEQEYEVKIDAISGAVLEVEEEEEDEDDDEVNDDNGDDDEVGSVPDDVLEKALSIVSGEVIKAELEMGIWEVYVLTESGGVVEVEIKDDTLALISVEGDEPPFDYEVTPGADFLTFSEAKTIVFDNFEGEIDSWEFEKDDNQVWVYEFILIVNQDEIKVEIDAKTGDIL